MPCFWYQQNGQKMCYMIPVNFIFDLINWFLVISFFICKRTELFCIANFVCRVVVYSPQAWFSTTVVSLASDTLIMLTYCIWMYVTIKIVYEVERSLSFSNNSAKTEMWVFILWICVKFNFKTYTVKNIKVVRGWRKTCVMN